MSNSCCTAINKTTGTRCKSYKVNAYGTCKRHPPAAPTDAELTTALAVLDSLPPLQPRPSIAGIKDMTVEQLDTLWHAMQACKVTYRLEHKHSYMYYLYMYLNIENEFTKRIRAIFEYNGQVAHDSRMIHNAETDKRRWAEAMETPLADTREGLIEQMDLVQDLYHYVEAADAGAGYQMWQIVLFEQLRGRMEVIKKGIDALDA